jgi:hypothetical protein
MRPIDPKRRARFAELIGLALSQAEAVPAVGVHAPRYARKLVLTPPLAGPGFHHGSSAAGCLPTGGLSTMMWLALLLALTDRCALLFARMADPHLGSRRT